MVGYVIEIVCGVGMCVVVDLVLFWWLFVGMLLGVDFFCLNEMEVVLLIGIIFDFDL